MSGKENGSATLEHMLLQGINNKDLQEVLKSVLARDPDQVEFLEAVKEVVSSLEPVFDRRPELIPIFGQMCEPERVITFRVPWLDDKNQLRINRGFRVQNSSAIGPYKGGLRFHPTVKLSIIKMLAFEQCFKNALTSLPLGAGKGGSDFDPKGKSDGEIQRFCQSFMTELFRHIDDDKDVPAGDIGVGAREIGYLFGQYKRLSNHFQGSLTGKGSSFGGSICRLEATGYGVVFLANEVVADKGGEKFTSLEGARCAVSGSGNVARYCAMKLQANGAKVISISDSKGTVVVKEGFTKEQLEEIQEIKSTHNGRLEDYKNSNAQYFGDRAKPWTLEETGDIDMAFPCATQGEFTDQDAEALAAKGCWAVIEGANMPCTATAVEVLKDKGILHVPGKMANAGGVAVSGLEMMQNRTMAVWDGQEVYDKLQEIMKHVYSTCKKASEEYGVDLGAGANIAAFLKVATAVAAQGAV